MDSDPKRSARHAPLDEESVFVLVIRAIKRFLARLCQGFSAGHFSQASSSDASGQALVNTPAASVCSQARTLSGTEEAWASKLDDVQRSVSAIVDTVAGDVFPPSLEAALALPPSERRRALRELLQHNFSDSHRIREACMILNHLLEEEIASFSAEHHLTPASALAIFRADREGQGSAIADRVDPNHAPHSITAKLKRLESALAGLTHARGRISTHAIASGAYTREALAAMIAQQGFDTAFLFQTETAKPIQAHPAPKRTDIQDEAPTDSVSDPPIFGLDTGVQADELDVFFKNSVPFTRHEFKKDPSPSMRARS